MNNKKNTLSVALSIDELFVILSYLNANSLTGIDTELLNELSEKEKTLVLGAAERALLARGFLVRAGEHNLKLIDPVVAVVGTCAFPEKSIILQVTRPESAEEMYFFHSARKMRVMHTIPLTAVHQFIAVETSLEFTKAILSVVQLKETIKPDALAGTVPSKTLAEARNAVWNSRQENAIRLFTNAGLKQSTSTLFVQALAHPSINASISSIENTNTHQKVNGFSILGGSDSLWVLTPDQDNDNVEIDPVSTQEVTEKLKTLTTI